MIVRCGACRTQFEVAGAGRFSCPACGSVNVVRNQTATGPASAGAYPTAPGAPATPAATTTRPSLAPDQLSRMRLHLHRWRHRRRHLSQLRHRGPDREGCAIGTDGGGSRGARHRRCCTEDEDSVLTEEE